MEVKHSEPVYQGLLARPRFRDEVIGSKDIILNNLKAALETENDFIHGYISNSHLVLKIRLAHQHYWSPELQADLEQQHEKTVIRGLIGPKPGVWTMFMFFYALATFFGTFALIIGSSQWSLDKTPYMLWVFGFCMLFMIILFFVAKAGQKLAHEQMVQLKRFLDQQMEAYEDQRTRGQKDQTTRQLEDK